MSVELEEQCRALEAENALLRKRIKNLVGAKQDVNAYRASRFLKLTAYESALISELLNYEFRRREQLRDKIYSPRLAPPGANIIDVFVCKMRKKLKPFGVRICTAWGQGYYLTPEDKKKIRDILEENLVLE